MEETELKSAARIFKMVSRRLRAEGLDLAADLEKSRGSYLYDLKRGGYFLDFFGCFATLPLGYNHPRIHSSSAREELSRAAVQKPANPSVYTRQLADFLEIFEQVAMPGCMKYIFLIEGGAPAVENALKAAFDWKIRKNFTAGTEKETGTQILHFQQAFHGRTGYALSLTNTADPNKTRYFPKFSWPRVLNPKCFFPLQGGNLQKTIEAEEEALRQIHRAIQENPEDIAGLIIEPIQGEGGDNHFRSEFHQALRRICDENDILLIYDEVQTGFGSTGKMWGFEHYVEPDLIAFGKKAQVCGILAGSRIDEVPENVFRTSSRINSTWGGNLVDMVRSRMILEVYRDEQIVEQSAAKGRLLLDELHNLQDEIPALVSNVRGRGLFCAMDLPDGDFRNRFRRKLFENRLIMLGCGKRSIRFRTALNIPEVDLMKGVEIIRQTLKSMA